MFLSPALGPIFDFGGIFEGLNINFYFLTAKRHTLAWDHVVWTTKLLRCNYTPRLFRYSANSAAMWI